MDLPLFPLHTVLCPGIALPLHIFEPRYRLLVSRCLERDEPFGVVWIRAGREVGPGDLAVAEVGTTAEIREADRYADGRYDLVAIGTGRFRIHEVYADREPYLVARVTEVEEALGDETAAARLARIATRRFVRYVEQVRALAETADAEADDPSPGAALGERLPSEPEEPRQAESVERAGLADEPTEGSPPDRVPILGIPADPTLLSHLLSGIVELDLPRRQSLLEAPTTEARLADLAAVLRREVAYLEQQLRVLTPDPRLLAVRRN
jgi:Lon protease-like protein